MKKHAIYFLMAILFANCYSCKHSAEINNSKLQILSEVFAGDWYNAQSNVWESWKIDGNTLAGSAFSLQDKDTILYEKLKIFKQDSFIFYEATVLNQNEGKPVKFKLASFNDQKIVFENPDHDFPKKITYHFLTTDSLKVQVLGNEKTIDFYFRKLSK